MSNDTWAKALEDAESPERRDRGLWARCFAEADGDEARAKAAYVRAVVAGGPSLSQAGASPVSSKVEINPPDGYCPNCAAPCYLKASRCNVCGAEFDGSSWRPVAEKPAGVEPRKRKPEAARSPSPPPPTPSIESKGGSSWWKWLIGIPVVGFILMMVIGTATDSPERQQRFREADAIKLCWQEQSRKSLDPGTSRFVAGACERMESDFRQRWGRAP